MEALLAGDYDDDDSDDDESFEEGKEEPEDDDDDDDDENDESEGVAVPSRLPLHLHACAGKVDSLRAALDEGARSGEITIGFSSDGMPRSVVFDLNQANDESEPPLHAALLTAANALALAAAPPEDPWARAAARDDARLLASPVPTPLATSATAVASLDAEAEARLSCAKMLLEAGAEPERKVYGRSALHLACACAALPALAPFASRVTALLLAHGASVTSVDACGKTPVHYAAVASGTAALEQLLKQPTATEAVGLADKSGATALHDALRAGQPCAANAHLLIATAASGGGCLTAADMDGLTPYASRGFNPRLDARCLRSLLPSLCLRCLPAASALWLTPAHSLPRLERCPARPLTADR